MFNIKNILFFLIPVIFVSTLTYASIQSSGYFVCVRENGTADIVVSGFTKKQDCKNKELKIEPPKELHVFDSKNVDLGKFVSFDYLDTSRYLIYDQDLKLNVRYSMLYIGEITNQTMYFDGQNCAGKVFMDKDSIVPDFVYSDFYNLYTYDKENTDDIIISSGSTNNGSPNCYDYGSHNSSAKGKILLKKIDSLYQPTFPLYIKNI